MKLFGKGGKLNIIDIILIVAVLAIIVFALVAPSLSTDDGNEVGEAPPAAIVDGENEVNEQNIIFTVGCEDVDAQLAQSIIASLESGNSLFGEEDDLMTRLYNNHKLIDAHVSGWEYDDNGTLLLTVKGTATYSNGAFSVGTQEVRIGRSYFVKTMAIEIEGVVYSMEKNDE